MKSLSKCGLCGKGFTCEAEGGNKCWCESLPPFLKPIKGSSCHCPECLKLLYDLNLKIPAGAILSKFSRENDSADELTRLLRRAYQRLADLGLKFLATHQDEQTTLKRITKGECFIIRTEGKIIATICYYNPQNASGTDWYNKSGVSYFGQFAVEPSLQEKGIGGLFLSFVEHKAFIDGASEIALDTSENAPHLINYYTKKGYRFIEYKQWDVTNYRSVVMSKKL